MMRAHCGTVDVSASWTSIISAPRQASETVLTGRLRWDSDPFGTNAANENPAGLGVFKYHLRFPGQQYDGLAGLYYNYYRDYDPAVGRYVESDPIGLAAGVNTFAYASENAISLADQDELEAVDAMRRQGWGLEPNEANERRCAWSAFVRNYNAMIAANTIGADRYFHCRANCETTKCGKSGNEQACTISDVREFSDTYVKYPYKRLIGVHGSPTYEESLSDSLGDQVAKEFGRNGAVNSRQTSCSVTCSAFRPQGLSNRF
jgi:RHS repeat-associated protein